MPNQCNWKIRQFWKFCWGGYRNSVWSWDILSPKGMPQTDNRKDHGSPLCFCKSRLQVGLLQKWESFWPMEVLSSDRGKETKAMNCSGNTRASTLFFCRSLWWHQSCRQSRYAVINMTWQHNACSSIRDLPQIVHTTPHPSCPKKGFCRMLQSPKYRSLSRSKSLRMIQT